MNIRLAIALALAGALAFACSPRSRSASPSEPSALATAMPLKTSAFNAPAATTEIAERPHRRSTSSSKTEPKLDSRFNVTVAPRGIQFALGVTNVGKKHVELTFRSGQSYDFVVVDSVGREVWRWSNGRMFTQGVQNKQLSTGDTMRARELWTAPVPGRYTAIATLNSTNFPTEQRADFVVP
jgi:Intracellular proteinase inhibitor